MTKKGSCFDYETMAAEVADIRLREIMLYPPTTAIKVRNILEWFLRKLESVETANDWDPRYRLTIRQRNGINAISAHEYDSTGYLCCIPVSTGPSDIVIPEVTIGSRAYALYLAFSRSENTPCMRVYPDRIISIKFSNKRYGGELYRRTEYMLHWDPLLVVNNALAKLKLPTIDEIRAQEQEWAQLIRERQEFEAELQGIQSSERARRQRIAREQRKPRRIRLQSTEERSK